MKKRKGVFLFLFLFSFQAFAQKSETVYTEYYTISERNSNAGTNSSGFYFSPTFFLQATQQLIVNLLHWTRHNEYRPVPSEAYIRKIHFGRWINDPTDDTCMNTRAKVLVRDSESDVTYRSDRQCVVNTGRWLDPYSNSEHEDSREIQIDHMVPLKNAYMAGAWKWDFKTRCLYANYMGYHNHLIPSSVRENTSKGDRSPDQYLPPENSYRCQYVKDWLSIKLIWNLNMTENEAQAIYDVVVNNNCPSEDFQISQAELEEQRQFIYSNLDFCIQNAQ
ncbi:MAG: HNH endonuclease family protein [Bdellovibrio sp.]